MQIETTTQKAAKVRADIRAALKSGELGTVPAGLKISVRTEYASCMSAIDVTLKGAPDEWALTGPVTDRGFPERRISDECQALSGKLLAIVGRHYSPNGCQSFAEVSLENGVLVGCGRG